MIRFFLILILTSVTFGEIVVAGVELRESTITSELKTVPAGTTVTINVILKNSGDKLAEGIDVRIRIPYCGFIVRIDELAGYKRDEKEREVSATVDIPAGAECRFSFDLLASRTEVGHHLSTYIEAVYLLDQVRWNSESSIRITNIPSTAGIVLGGLRFYPAAGWMLGWMVCFGLLFVWLRTRLKWVKEHPHSNTLPVDVRRIVSVGAASLGIVSLVMIPMAFLMVLGGMAWRDLQSMTRWQEAEATILDRREIVQGGETEYHKDRRRTKTGVTRTPEFALKYQANQREVISSGFETGPSLHIGKQILDKAKVDEWVVGNTVPCWFDPDNPGDVVVQRGFGGKYIVFGLFFGLLPLGILWFGLRQIRNVGNAVRRLV